MDGVGALLVGRTMRHIGCVDYAIMPLELVDRVGIYTRLLPLTVQ
jgi:hypothetical protein